MRLQRLLMVLLATLLAELLCGLPAVAPAGGIPLPAAQQPAAKTTAAGDPAAALEKLGAQITRDDQGVVTGVIARGEKFTDATLAPLVRLTGLESLELGRCAITDVALTHLRGLTGLQRSTSTAADHRRRPGQLPGPNRPDGPHALEDAGHRVRTGISQAAGQPRSLEPQSSPVTDAPLAHLKGLTELNTLGLQGTKITDAGLVHLKPLAKLRVLNLSQTRITDRNLKDLAGLTELRMLYLEEDPIKEESVQKFQDGMPGLAVYY